MYKDKDRYPCMPNCADLGQIGLDLFSAILVRFCDEGLQGNEN